MPRPLRAVRAMLGAVLLLAAPAACGTPPPGTSATPTPGRLSSTATVEIVSPVNGLTVHGKTVHIVVVVHGGHVIQPTTTDVKPDEGHVHILLDGSLIYMSYTLSEDFPLTHTGPYRLQAEFVASDHGFFNPRVRSAPVEFTVVP